MDHLRLVAFQGFDFARTVHGDKRRTISRPYNLQHIDQELSDLGSAITRTMLNIKLLALSFLNVTIYAQAPSACLSLISSVSSCSSKYSAFHATVTDEKEAIATAQACLCGNSQAFVSGVSACESHTKEAKAALATAIGMEMNMDVLPELGGLCDKSGAMMTAARV